MAYAIRMKVDVVWLPEGAGGMTQADAQSMSFFPSSTSALGLPNVGMAQYVPLQTGGDTPAKADFTTALNSATADIATQINTNLTQIKNWASGGG